MVVVIAWAPDFALVFESCSLRSAPLTVPRAVALSCSQMAAKSPLIPLLILTIACLKSSKFHTHICKELVRCVVFETPVLVILHGFDI